MLDRVLFGSVTLLQFLQFLAVILTALLTVKILGALLNRRLRGRINEDQLQLIRKLVRYGIFLLTLLIALPFLGIKLSGLMVAGGLAGVVVGFASQNVVSNLISGIFVMIERPVRIGNAVDIAGKVGIVEEIRIMSTIVRTFDGLYVRIPNINVFTSMLINHEANIARRIDYSIGIRYSDDAPAATKLIHDLLVAEPMILHQPAPVVFVGALADSAVTLNIRAWAPTAQYWELRMKLLQTIRAALEEAGYQIPFPQREVWQAQDKALAGQQCGETSP